MSTQTISMTPILYEYLLKSSLHEHNVLKQLRDETQQLPQFEMQISPEQGQLMALLVQILQAKKTLDIGTFTGYSALVVAQALPVDGQVISCDISTTFTKTAKHFWELAGVSDKIDLRIAPAIDTLNELMAKGEANTFDFAFIDADKNNYQLYYEATLNLLRPGGLIAVDNVLWSGKVADEDNQEKETKILRAFNAFVFNDKRVNLSMVPIGDGLSLIRKNFNRI